jgi:hypothetical protein
VYTLQQLFPTPFLYWLNSYVTAEWKTFSRGQEGSSFGPVYGCNVGEWVVCVFSDHASQYYFLKLSSG